MSMAPDAPEVAPPAGAPKRNRFSPEQIQAIRRDRARTKEDGSPANSHMALAKKYGTSAGTISQIVRNRTYTDPNFTPAPFEGA